MHVAIDVTHLPWDRRGMGRYVRSLLPLLLEAAPDLSFEAFSAKRFPAGAARELPAAIPFRELSNPRRGAAGMADLVWFPWNLPSFTPQPFGVPVPAVLTIHDCVRFRFPKSGWWGWYETWKERRELQAAAGSATRIVADAEFSREEIVRHLAVPREKVTVIPLGVDRRIFFPRPREEVEAALAGVGVRFPYLLYAGAVQPSKNVELLLHTFARLRREGIPHHLVVAGSCQRGYREEIRAVTADLRLPEWVRLLEGVDDEILPLLYAGADLFVFPSAYEGFGLPPLEAMACGAPVVASAAASLPEVVGEAGCLVDLGGGARGGAVRLADAIKRLLQDDEVRRRYVELGFVRARAFRWEETARRLVALFREAARKDQGAPAPGAMR